ncbi:MAG: 4Fe-4S binding protein [Erysipelotrichaceae bacterium]|nr:4Fe-4S binding protein [Erysipelotrichaceae bacterium]MDD3809868.1 4Fe-4S binding protein [Erysipelotrichaceae bacterium]
MRKAIINQKQCVSCGACVKVCPRDAIEIYKGMYAKVDLDKCVGCSLCKKACPASVIEMEDVK